MISYESQFITEIGDATFTIPGHTCRGPFSNEVPTYPLIIIEERPTNLGVSVDGQPRITTNSYQVDIYCQNMEIGGIITLASNVALQLGLEVDKFLNESFNFTNVGDPVRGVIGSDNNIAYMKTRYRITTDQDTGYIYR